MTKEFIPYEEALALKELGFNEPCFARYSDMTLPKKMGSFLSRTDWDTVHVNLIELESISAPLYQQAFRWFREKYKLHSYVHTDYSWNISGGIWDLNEYKDSRYDWDSEPYKTYEEAELECLRKLIQLVNEKKG